MKVVRGLLVLALVSLCGDGAKAASGPPAGAPAAPAGATAAPAGGPAAPASPGAPAASTPAAPAAAKPAPATPAGGAATVLTAGQVRQAAMFLFVWQERLPSKLLYPLGFLMVDQDGHGLYVFAPSKGIWKRGPFVVSKETVGELRRLIAQSGFLNVDRLQQDGRAADGGVIYVAVQAGGAKKTVWCDSKFPEAVVKITDFVKQEILASQQAALAQAEKCTESEVALLDQLAVSLRY
jgi:hypothetical protein